MKRRESHLNGDGSFPDGDAVRAGSHAVKLQHAAFSLTEEYEISGM